MAIKVTANGASANKPGTYPAVKAQNLTGFPLQPTGIVAIVGEAVGGEPGVLDVLEGMAIQAAKARYKSGPIADALGLLVSHKDLRVPSGASRIIIYKTNVGTRSAKSLQNSAGSPVDQVNLTSKNWGADENNLGVQLVTGSLVDANAKILGSTVGPIVVASGQTLILKMFGTTYTFTNTLVGSQTAAAIVGEINTAARWTSSVKPVIASVVGGAVQIAVDPTVVIGSELEYGYLSVDPVSTIDTVIDITGTARGVRGSRTIFFKKDAVIENIPVGGPGVISVKYIGTGTSSVLTIQDSLGSRVLTTTCAGASGDNLNLVLGVTENGGLVNKMTIASLVDQINSFNGGAAYVATVQYPNGNLATTDLDFYNAVHIEGVAISLKRDIADLVAQVNVLSALASAERISNIYGTLAVVTSYVFFTGGTNGVSTNTNYSDGFEAFKEIRAEIVVPLISQDIGAASIDVVNALADAHAAYSWSAAGRSPRQAFVSKLCSKTQLKAAAQALNSGYTSIFGEDIRALNPSSEFVWFDPWAQACIAAAMQAGSTVGEPITFKHGLVNNIRVRDGSWNPRVDFSEMIDAGVTFMEAVDSGGFRFVVGNTTYSTDSSFVWNRMSVVEAVGYLYYDLMVNLEAEFTGTKAKTGSATAIANLIKSRMEIYLTNEIIVGDDLNKGLGFKNLKTQLGGSGFGGNTAQIDVTVTPVQGIDFILPTIYLADIQQKAT